MMKSLRNKLLDASIYYSFDKSGYLRHEKNFSSDLVFSKTKKALVTGGTSGIGHSVATALAEHGLSVTITGRNQEKGQQAASKNSLLSFFALDSADWDQISDFVANLEPLDFIVLNAGGMPDNFTTNPYGVELQMASQLMGHHFLLRYLEQAEKLKKNARIVWVSSGGMYLKSLNLDTIFTDEKYDKVATYANVKRAQVSLLDYFCQQFAEQKIFAMHPGWVATPGVQTAIPGFFNKMKDRLRTPLQGADTILWLLSENAKPENGKFYFDREQVSTSWFFWTRPSENEIQQLIQAIETLWQKTKN